MRFVTWEQMVADATVLAGMLRGRGLQGVIAIPRSGYFPGAIVAQILGLPMVGLDHFAQDGFKQGLAVGRMAGKPVPGAGSVLVIDDSVYRGSAIEQAQRVLKESDRWSPLFAALYVCEDTPAAVRPDIGLTVCPRPRLFAWNWLGHSDLARTLFDFDGVFCPDGPADESPDYAAWLAGAPALHLPTVPIRGIVTHRLEPWREVSERWLASAGIKYGSLRMHPAATPEDRRAQAYGIWKGEVYAADEEAMLFVESSSTQAKMIAEVAHKPVLCVANWVVYQGA